MMDVVPDKIVGPEGDFFLVLRRQVDGKATWVVRAVKNKAGGNVPKALGGDAGHIAVQSPKLYFCSGCSPCRTEQMIQNQLRRPAQILRARLVTVRQVRLDDLDHARCNVQDLSHCFRIRQHGRNGHGGTKQPGGRRNGNSG